MYKRHNTQCKQGEKEGKKSFENIVIFMSHVGTVCPSLVTMATVLGCIIACEDTAEDNSVSSICSAHTEKLCQAKCSIPGQF